jgi:hypothetical protein
MCTFFEDTIVTFQLSGPKISSFPFILNYAPGAFSRYDVIVISNYGVKYYPNASPHNTIPWEIHYLNIYEVVDVITRSSFAWWKTRGGGYL